MHCHIEYHALNGMALVVQSGETRQMWPAPPRMARCGDFNLRDDEYWEAERNEEYRSSYMIDSEVLPGADVLGTIAEEIKPNDGEIDGKTGVKEASK